ncbi:MAG: EscU/YscU/HrcU family type III secretion system export apparatus switch protein, partial [Proteobacteria bacterium]|nr:EscU/YscU/HrcU family type III secretion system export apparatus switch protein [Pseudomonadota bacterium]
MAVALGHDLVDDRPPKVVAGGRGRIAEQILEIAFAHGVKVREDADLAQLLTSIDIDSEIPVEAFAAVAEILTYVYQANAGHPAPGEQGPGEQGPGEQGPGEQGPGEQGPGEQGNGAGPSDGGLSN